MNHLIASIFFGIGSGLSAMIMRKYFNFPRRERISWKAAISFGVFNFIFVGFGMYLISTI